MGLGDNVRGGVGLTRRQRADVAYFGAVAHVLDRWYRALDDEWRILEVDYVRAFEVLAGADVPNDLRSRASDLIDVVAPPRWADPGQAGVHYLRARRAALQEARELCARMADLATDDDERRYAAWASVQVEQTGAAVRSYCERVEHRTTAFRRELFAVPVPDEVAASGRQARFMAAFRREQDALRAAHRALDATEDDLADLLVDRVELAARAYGDSLEVLWELAPAGQPNWRDRLASRLRVR